MSIEYVSKEDLASLLEDFYTTGQYSRKLDDVVLRICSGVLSRYRTGFRYGDVIAEDILSDAHLACSQAILDRKVSIDRNPFGYLTRVAVTTLFGRCRGENERAREIKEYLKKEGRNT